MHEADDLGLCIVTPTPQPGWTDLAATGLREPSTALKSVPAGRAGRLADPRLARDPLAQLRLESLLDFGVNIGAHSRREFQRDRQAVADRRVDAATVDPAIYVDGQAIASSKCDGSVTFENLVLDGAFEHGGVVCVRAGDTERSLRWLKRQTRHPVALATGVHGR